MEPTIYKPRIYNGAGIYNNGGNGGGGGGGGSAPVDFLPSGYTPLDKINFKGENTSYLYKIFNGNGSFKFVINGKVNEFKNRTTQTIFKAGSYIAIDVYDNQNIYVQNTSGIYGYFNTGFSKELLLENFEIILNSDKFYLNGSEVTIPYISTSFNNFYISMPSTPSPDFDLYGLKIYNGTSLNFYGVPAKDENSHSEGLFDLVSNTFSQKN